MLVRSEAANLSEMQAVSEGRRAARAALAAVAGVVVAGLVPTAARAQVIVGSPPPVVIEQPAAVYGSYPVFTFPGTTTYSSGFAFGTPFGFDSFGTLPTAGFTFGATIPPQGYYDWAGGPSPFLDIGPAVGLPVASGVVVNSPFVANPAPPPATPVPVTPSQPALPDSAFIQHGRPRIIVKVGRIDQSRAATKSQVKPKNGSGNKQTTSKQKPSG
jgi:hypothetical protein